MYDLRLLSSFIAVARLRHFGRAAEQLHATQPGVSQHIAKLEEQLGFMLLQRTRRQVELTTAGESFYAYAVQIVHLAERAQVEGRQLAEGGSGKLMLGIASAVVYSGILSRIATYRAQVPKMDIEFFVHGGDRLKKLLDRGTIDLAITTLPMTSPLCQSVVIGEQHMGVALPAGHRLATQRVLTLNNLKNESFIVVPRADYPEFHDALLGKLHNLGVLVQIAGYETPFLNAVARVAVGEGVAIVGMGYRGEASGGVRVVRLNDPQLGRMPIYAVVRKDGLRPSVMRVIEALTNY